MSQDILDTLDDDDNELFEEAVGDDDVLLGEVEDTLGDYGTEDVEDTDDEAHTVLNELGEEEDSADLELVDDNDLTRDEAEEITNAIKSTAIALHALLARAHEGKAYRALGYGTWKEYIDSEFDFSTQRAYQLLNLDRTIKAIEEVAPDGYQAKITEAQARDIKRELPKITEQIAEQTQGMSAEDSHGVIEDIINEQREQQKADEKALADKERREQEERQQAEHDEMESQADAFLEEHEGEPGGLSEKKEWDEDSPGADSVSSRQAINLQNFFNMLSVFDALPTPEDMIQLIPQEREDDVHKVVAQLKDWFDEFERLWDENM